MILKKQTYYDGENEKKKVSIMQNDEKSYTCFVKTKGNGQVSVLESVGQNFEETVKMVSEIFKIPISIDD